MSRKSDFPLVDCVALAKAVVDGAKEQGLQQLPKETERDYRLFLRWCEGGRKGQMKDIAGEFGITGARAWRIRADRHWIGRVERWAMARMEKTAEVCDPDWEARQDLMRREEWALYEELVKSGREALERWRESDKVPSLGEVVRVWELASRLGRLAAGLPLNHTEISGNPSSPIKVELEMALAKIYGEPKIIDVESQVESSGELGR